jgi:hypothetical protein
MVKAPFSATAFRSTRFSIRSSTMDMYNPPERLRTVLRSSMNVQKK